MTHDNTLKPITVTIQTALHISGLGRTKLYALIKQGVIKSVTVGKRRLVTYASLEELGQATLNGGSNAAL